MDNSLLLQSIREWHGAFVQNRTALSARRPLAAPSVDLALALTGVRRSGKTFMATQASTEFAADEVLYYNFEDPLFHQETSPTSLDVLLGLAQEFRTTPIKLLILDELQNISGWERWARKLIDQKRYRIIVTGSSAKLLSSELATSLTGRTIEKHVWPLSYQEFLQFTAQQPKNQLEHRASFRTYLEEGGFPQPVLLSNSLEKRTILTQYLSDILFKDVLQRNEIRDARALSAITTYLFTNLSSPHSYTAIRKAFGLSFDLVASYLSALTSAFLIFEVERYHKNLKVQARDSRKVYVIDNGLRSVVARSPNDDTGKLLENVVYLELRRRSLTVMYYKEDQEVDFLVLDGYRPVEALQVCAEGLTEPTTRKRELGALEECMRDLKLKEGTIVSLSHEETVYLPRGKVVKIVPAYQWMVGNA